MSKICEITQKKANNAYSISHSHIRTKKKQEVNLQNKKIWLIKQQKWIKVKIATKTIKSFRKIF
uniref:Large ribosomal subunit protein bL28c n=1 Tax=Caulacanthus okamurae TaxID=152008 RepID=A0A6H1U8F4_9FLOR|nr:50S ribosomal protein L28 [Caulacanthus okamurae]QIZ74726.1 50S ribosomal protein L28 [Caulacanthus okamurae]